MAKKDLVSEALEQVESLKNSAMQNAKNVLVNAMSTDLKAAVSKAVHETIHEGEVPTERGVNYHDGKKDKNLGTDRVGDEVPVKGDTGDELPEGDGPAIVETGIEEMDDEMPFDDEEDGDDEFEEMGMYEEDDEEDLEDDDLDVDMEIDDEMEDDDEDVIEVIEGEGMDDEEDDEEQLESAVAQLKAENKRLRFENKRQGAALGKIKRQMDEINLFNARLAAASDLMRRTSLTTKQKERVVEHMDRCRSIGEVKRAHRMLFEGYRAASVKRVRASRPNVQSVISEDRQNTTQTKFARLAELAGLK